MKPPTLRSLTTLYRLDRTFARLANFMGITFVFSITLGWVSGQMKTFGTVEDAGIDTRALIWASVAGFALVLLALVFLLRRHQWIHRVIAHGITIKGMIEKIDVHTHQLKAEKHAPWSPRLIKTYFAVVTYDCRGATRKVRLKLPTLPSSTAITQGAEIDLLILPSAPGKPLLRKIFENWARTCG